MKLNIVDWKSFTVAIAKVKRITKGAINKDWNCRRKITTIWKEQNKQKKDREKM